MKGRKHRDSGGDVGKVDEAKEDLKPEPDRSSPNNVAKEAEEKKHGGRAKRARGGKMEHKVHGESKHHMGRKARKSGGRASSDQNPFTSARSGKAPKGHATPGGLSE